MQNIFDFFIFNCLQSSNPPFTSIELDHSDSGREGCTVTTLTVTAEPKNWQSAIKVAVQEVCGLGSSAMHCISFICLDAFSDVMVVFKSFICHEWNILWNFYFLTSKRRWLRLSWSTPVHFYKWGTRSSRVTPKVLQTSSV